VVIPAGIHKWPGNLFIELPGFRVIVNKKTTTSIRLYSAIQKFPSVLRFQRHRIEF